MADISSITLPGGGTYDLKDKNAVPKYGMGKNLLRNWYFVGGGTGKGTFPVNQRGQSSYSRNSYSIDGWFVNNTTNFWASLTSSSLTLTSSSYTGVFLEYIPHLQFGKQYTFSVLFSDGSIVATTGKINDSSEYIRVAFSGGAIVVWYDQAQIQCFGGYSFGVIATKLELGTEQTLAHQENGVWVLNEIPDYEYELYRCMTSTADSSDTYANKSLATEQQLAYVETGITASQNYTAGQYICWNGLLCTADTAIANGATFYTSGGNKNLTECVGGGLNNIKSTFGLKTSALTGVASGTATNIIYYNDYFVQILFTSAGKTWNDGDTIGTIPSELRPPYEIKGVATSYNPMTAFQITIPPITGAIATENRNSVTSRISFNIIYLR